VHLLLVLLIWHFSGQKIDSHLNAFYQMKLTSCYCERVLLEIYGARVVNAFRSTRAYNFIAVYNKSVI
jgi:hypothetical protein